MAEQWFMAKYVMATTVPTFDVFVQEFKKRFTCADNSRQLHLTIKSIALGSRAVLMYHTEFQTLLCQLGEDGIDKDWARMHFKCGLRRNIRRHVAVNGHTYKGERERDGED